MKIYPKIIRTLLPLAHFMQGKRSSEYLRELEKSQWYGYDKIKEIQWKRLKAMLQHAYYNVPFYHERFRKSGLKPDDIKAPRDMLRLPIVTKEDISGAVANGEILAKNVSHKRFHRNSTGGSTGKPFTFYNDEIQLEYRWASTNRNMRWTGYDIGNRIVKLWSDAQYLARSATLKERFSHYLWRRRILSAYRMDEKTMENYVKIMKEYKPKLVVGYASALYLFAKFMEKRGINDVQTNAVISSAETLFPRYRSVMEDRFNCKVFNRYGTREFSTLAHECDQHFQLHMNAENLFIEVVKDGEHVSSGELGEIIVTDLHNFCMPFIRYRIEDTGVPSDEACNCGRGLPLLKKIEGRIHSILLAEDGTYIAGEFFPHLFKDVRGIRQFQVVQEVKSELLLRVVKGEDYIDEEMKKALTVIKQFFGESMKISLEFVDEIPLTPSGKTEYTICKLPIKFS